MPFAFRTQWSTRCSQLRLLNWTNVITATRGCNIYKIYLQQLPRTNKDGRRWPKVKADTHDKSSWCNNLAHAYKKIHTISQQRPHTFLCSLVNITTYRQPIHHLRFGHSRTLYIFTSLSPESKPLVPSSDSKNHPEFWLLWWAIGS